MIILLPLFTVEREYFPFPPGTRGDLVEFVTKNPFLFARLLGYADLLHRLKTILCLSATLTSKIDVIFIAPSHHRRRSFPVNPFLRRRLEEKGEKSDAKCKAQDISRTPRLSSFLGRVVVVVVNG